MAEEDQFTHYHQRVRAEFDVIFKVPKKGPGETTRVALQDAACKEVSHYISTSRVDIDAMRGPSGSQPIYNNGEGIGSGGPIPKGIIADWPEEE